MAVDLLKRRFTVDEYHRMGDAGILSETDRVELLDGEIIAMSSIGARHMACVDRANRLLVLAARDRAIVHVQSSIRLDRYNEPEPDLVLLRPQADFYASRIPGAAETLLVIEISETSLDYDIQTKARLYAAFTIAEYWVVDLEADRVVRHTDPADNRYRSVQTHGPSDILVPTLLPDCTVRVADLLGI